MNIDRWALLMLVLVTVSAIGAVYSKHRGRELFVSLQAATHQRDDLDLEWGRLQLEQRTIADTSVVDYTARMRLKMAAPKQADVIYVRP